MKLEDFLMQTREEHRRRCELEEEVTELQGVLNREERLSRILRCALQGPIILSRSGSSSLLPLQVQVILAELALVEEEIIYLQRKSEELRFSLSEEKKRTEEVKLQHHKRWLRQRRRGNFLCRVQDGEKVHGGAEHERQFAPASSQMSPTSRTTHAKKERNISLGSISEMELSLHTSADAEVEMYSKLHNVPDQMNPPSNIGNLPDEEEKRTATPTDISEELVRCLIGIFHRLNRTAAGSTRDVCHDHSPAIISKFGLSCISSQGIASKPSSFHYFGERGPYKNFVSVTGSSLDMGRISHCSSSIRRLRLLMNKLCKVDITFLTYKQKLAFWINIYNACIMHAFLRDELPTSSDKVLALLNRAAVNVGGIVLNALAIEHFILRYPCNSKNSGVGDEKETLLRDTYGLNYPEPDVTFALCRGTRSSPPMRVYTGDNIVSELERAKIEYLEACVRTTSRRRILLPELLCWHMKDFADEVESLVEWIYSQLPRSGSLKKSIMECLQGDSKLSVAEMVEVEPYESEFRYLLPFQGSLDFS